LDRQPWRKAAAFHEPGFPAQFIGSGPTARYSAVPETFETVIYSAQRELFITTPYYVPVDSLQAAIRAAANRGVDTSIIFPARNDDFAVGATSKDPDPMPIILNHRRLWPLIQRPVPLPIRNPHQHQHQQHLIESPIALARYRNAADALAPHPVEFSRT
jgi:hypothetical protein